MYKLQSDSRQKKKKKAILKTCPSHSNYSKPLKLWSKCSVFECACLESWADGVHDEESSKFLGGWKGRGLHIQDLAETAGYLGGILQEHPLPPSPAYILSLSPLFSAVGY